jgi:hypothetical protein
MGASAPLSFGPIADPAGHPDCTDLLGVDPRAVTRPDHGARLGRQRNIKLFQ